MWKIRVIMNMDYQTWLKESIDIYKKLGIFVKIRVKKGE